MEVKKKKIEAPSEYTDIGKQYLKESEKINTDTVEVRELSKEMNKGYMDTLKDTALKGKKNYTGTFYVVVLTKRERLIEKTLRNYFYARQTCPTPSYEQAVYKFNSKDESLTFLWMVPSKKLCEDMLIQRHDLNMVNDPLLPFVIDYVTGRLYVKAVSLNDEHSIENYLGDLCQKK